MKLALERYANLNSPIHRWEPTSKFTALLALIFAFAFVQKLALLPPMVLITILLYILAKLPLSFLLSRLRYPGLFLTAAVIFFPFVAGETAIISWGIFTIKEEGCQAALLIVTRACCILTVSLVLFGTAPILSSIKAMRSLRLPDIIVDMTLLTYRYLEELGAMLTTMEQSMKLRGFNSGKLTPDYLRKIAHLSGTLFVRSYERSQRIYQAMILRGYGYATSPNYSKKIQIKLDCSSGILSATTLLVAIFFIVASLS